MYFDFPIVYRKIHNIIRAVSAENINFTSRYLRYLRFAIAQSHSLHYTGYMLSSSDKMLLYFYHIL